MPRLYEGVLTVYSDKKKETCEYEATLRQVPNCYENSTWWLLMAQCVCKSVMRGPQWSVLDPVF